MHTRLGAMMVCACLVLAGCAEYSKPKRALAHHAIPVADKKPVPVTTQSITPVAAPTPELDPAPAVAMSIEEQLKAAWKNLCGLRNIEHVEKGRVNETEEQKHFIDEKCADARWDSHMP
jgi:hypothetical protein